MQLITIIVIILIANVLARSPTPSEVDIASDETDNEKSRKIIGSSVVTSVSVVLNGPNESPQFTDAVGKPIPRPLVPPQVGSPINLLNPDRYEFYTFNDNGELIKRLMTMKEIQSIVAGGEVDSGSNAAGGDNSHQSSMYENPMKTTIENAAPPNHTEQLEASAASAMTSEEDAKVQDIVVNVQNVLNREMEKKKYNNNTVHPILDTPDVSSSWSIILPAIFGNTGAEIAPNKVHQTIIMQPDSDVMENMESSTHHKKPIKNITTKAPVKPIKQNVTEENIMSSQSPFPPILINKKKPLLSNTGPSIVRVTQKKRPSITVTTPRGHPLEHDIVQELINNSNNERGTTESTLSNITTTSSSSPLSTTTTKRFVTTKRRTPPNRLKYKNKKKTTTTARPSSSQSQSTSNIISSTNIPLSVITTSTTPNPRTTLAQTTPVPIPILISTNNIIENVTAGVAIKSQQEIQTVDIPVQPLIIMDKDEFIEMNSHKEENKNMSMSINDQIISNSNTDQKTTAENLLNMINSSYAINKIVDSLTEEINTDNKEASSTIRDSIVTYLPPSSSSETDTTIIEYNEITTEMIDELLSNNDSEDDNNKKLFESVIEISNKLNDDQPLHVLHNDQLYVEETDAEIKEIPTTTAVTIDELPTESTDTLTTIGEPITMELKNDTLDDNNTNITLLDDKQNIIQQIDVLTNDYLKLKLPATEPLLSKEHESSLNTEFNRITLNEPQQSMSEYIEQIATIASYLNNQEPTTTSRTNIYVDDISSKTTTTTSSDELIVDNILRTTQNNDDVLTITTTNIPLITDDMYTTIVDDTADKTIQDSFNDLLSQISNDFSEDKYNPTNINDNDELFHKITSEEEINPMIIKDNLSKNSSFNSNAHSTIMGDIKYEILVVTETPTSVTMPLNDNNTSESMTNDNITNVIGNEILKSVDEVISENNKILLNDSIADDSIMNSINELEMFIESTETITSLPPSTSIPTTLQPEKSELNEDDASSLSILQLSMYVIENDLLNKYNKTIIIENNKFFVANDSVVNNNYSITPIIIASNELPTTTISSFETTIGNKNEFELDSVTEKDTTIISELFDYTTPTTEEILKNTQIMDTVDMGTEKVLYTESTPSTTADENMSIQEDDDKLVTDLIKDIENKIILDNLKQSNIIENIIFTTSSEKSHEIRLDNSELDFIVNVTTTDTLNEPTTVFPAIDMETSTMPSDVDNNEEITTILSETNIDVDKTNVKDKINSNHQETAFIKLGEMTNMYNNILLPNEQKLNDQQQKTKIIEESIVSTPKSTSTVTITTTTTTTAKPTTEKIFSTEATFETEAASSTELTSSTASPSTTVTESQLMEDERTTIKSQFLATKSPSLKIDDTQNGNEYPVKLTDSSSSSSSSSIYDRYQQDQQHFHSGPIVSHINLDSTDVSSDLLHQSSLAAMATTPLIDSTKNINEDVINFSNLCNEIAFKLWHSMTYDNPELSGTRSVVISPFAITSLLSMIFLGARGATSGEMNELLRLDDMVTFNPHVIYRNITDSVELLRDMTSNELANGAFVRELFSDRGKGKLLPFYKDKAHQFYSGYVEEINYSKINDIIRRRTNLLMKRHTAGRTNEYIKTNDLWMNPPLAAISANIFQTNCTSATVNQMDGEMFFQVLPTVRQRRLTPIPAVVYKNNFTAGYDPMLDATIAAIGHGDNIVSTIFLMPGRQGYTTSNDNLERLEMEFMSNAIDKQLWQRLLTTLIERPGLELQIPRFSHRSFINATYGLQKMGLNDLFNFDKADLRGLIGSTTKDLFISDMMQINTFSICGEDKITIDQHHIEVYPGPSNTPRQQPQQPLEQQHHAQPQRKRQRQILNKYKRFDGDIRRTTTMNQNNNHNNYQDYQRSFYDPLYDPKYLELPLPLRPRQARIPDAPRLQFDKPFLYFVRHNPTGMILYMGRFNPRLLP